MAVATHGKGLHEIKYANEQFKVMLRTIVRLRWLDLHLSNNLGGNDYATLTPVSFET